MNNPEVTVGILRTKVLNFVLHGSYLCQGQEVGGTQQATAMGDSICWNGQNYKELFFTPRGEEECFTLKGVTIGIHFHWEREEDQTFPGTLRLILEDGEVRAINVVPVETYLYSVISSEMKATSSPEFLKAHTVISRSWLLAQIEKRNEMEKERITASHAGTETEQEIIRWYDREDHTLFDVCADDHCQRYQGITRVGNPSVRQAVQCTHGEVLTSEGRICDARFSKCCGGITERFSTCWEDKDYSYLTPVRDSDDTSSPLPDLSDEAACREWIMSTPPAFCSTKDSHILRQILNQYDQETTDFYRWTVHYTQEELKALLLERLHMDFGDVLSLVPVKRGASGRLSLLQINGSRRNLLLGKELEIRRALSHSHLFSSAFVVEAEDIRQGVPQSFTFHGAGWGHGVGLCQIGAAVMGERGYRYHQILNHYYPGALIEKRY